MRPEVAQTIMFASMSDLQILDAYSAASALEPGSPFSKALGRELLLRLHRVDPKIFPLPEGGLP